MNCSKYEFIRFQNYDNINHATMIDLCCPICCLLIACLQHNVFIRKRNINFPKESSKRHKKGHLISKLLLSKTRIIL